jgi:benzoate-CoA ligase
MAAWQLDLPETYNASELLFHNLEAGRADKVAVHCEGVELSYGELAEMANRVGCGLRELGLEPGARVLMLLRDTGAFPAVFFGAIRAGYIPIPANTVLKPDDYAYLLQDSAAQVMVVDGPLYPLIEQIREKCPALQHVILVDGEETEGVTGWTAWLQNAGTDRGPTATHRDDPAFWLYSSGSTGFPKGVVHRHKSIRGSTETYGASVLRIREEDTTFSASKLFHAYGLGNNLTFPYSVGASTVLFPGRPTPEAIFDRIERHQPSLFFAVPTLYAAILAELDTGKPWNLGSVRLCVSAAEALPADVFRRWQERFGVEILDGIGSTELLHIFISNQAGRVKPGSTGVPVPGYEARIVDEEDRPVVPGESGDLLMRGDSAGAFYWNNPEATEHTMRDGWIFTGDRYHQDREGYFFYDGRSDDMLKVGGYWVSPIEVENTLIEHPAVLESAVVAVHDAAGLTKPKAFVVLQKGKLRSDELAVELQEFVKSKIARFKYPRQIEFVEDLPKTVTGKIQRFRLRDA